MRRQRTLLAAALAAAAACLLARILLRTPAPGGGAGGYAGSQGCRECHEDFYRLWAPSRHGTAMRPFGAEVAALVDPPAAPLEIGGQRFRAEPARGVVVEEGPGGRKEYRMIHAMGGKNVLYFLTPFERGRLQVLPVAWDVRRREWYDVAASGLRHAPNGRPDRALPWTDPAFTFNASCHGCHVSQIETNYDPAADAYRTTWREPGIACETCHGSGAEHVRIARETPAGAKRKDWGIVRGGRSFTKRQNNDACASCHARLTPLTGGFEPGDDFFDRFDLAALENSDFYPDGREMGETFTFTTWRLSPCARAGNLDCLHCHTSSGRTRFQGTEANRACLPCHAERVKSAAAHTMHDGKNGPAPSCADCHMPATEFARMRRTDHSMRPPAPAATIEFGSPNACNLCHKKATETPAWADAQVRKWRARDYQAPVLERARLVAAARRSDAARLDDILAYIARERREEVVAAGLIRLLDRFGDGRKWPALIRALKDPSPLVRSAAAAGLSGCPSPGASAALLEAAKDPLRLVRVRAAQALATLPAAALEGGDTAPYRKALEEYLGTLKARPDQWANRYNLGHHYLDTGRAEEAAAEFEAAARLQPRIVPPLVNAASAWARAGRTEPALRALERALAIAPDDAAANLNMGLLQAELGRTGKAEAHLRAAMKADPASAQAAFNLGVLLCGQGRPEGLPWLRKACELDPGNARYAEALEFHRRETPAPTGP